MSLLKRLVIGVAAGFLWAFPVSFIVFYAIKMTIGLRVSEEEELAGLDVTEHGMHAYPPAISEGVGMPNSTHVPGGTGSMSASPVPAQ